MRVEQTEHFRILYPSDGKHLAEKDLSNAFEAEIYLSIYDSPENYIEISEEEYYNLVNNTSEV